MSELYPKVHNSYILKGLPQGKSVNKEMLKTMIPVGVIFAIILAVKGIKDLAVGEMGLIEYLISIIISGVIGGAVMGYFLFAFRMLGTLFYEAAKSIPLCCTIFSAFSFSIRSCFCNLFSSSCFNFPAIARIPATSSRSNCS